MDELSQPELLKKLKSSEREIRQNATEALWRIWYSQKGILGLELLRRAQTYLDLELILK
ncbi:hypothetical protein IQ238_08985 [Pleurocapsales cyanobacterium LEGE 06147]|nr:hypothetical protein [Pleurocapsales cyanobacterium LEGE 06147]